jgi:hypothetical protein
MEPERRRNSDSTAYVASQIIKASAGRLFKLIGYNSGGAQFIQLHDSATLPADTGVPKVVITAAATSNFEIDFPDDSGRYFFNGIVVCNSSTGPTKTIGSANCWFSAIYK